MKSADFDYDLPAEAIAQTPSRRRDGCRLAVVERSTGLVRHARFGQLGAFLHPGDLLVLNDSRVLAARVPVRRASGGAVEVFLLDPLAPGEALPAFLRPAARVKFGEALTPERAPGAGAFVLEARRGDGSFVFGWRGRTPWSPTLLERLGLPPLPHYIRRQRLPSARSAALDRRRYQTVYAQRDGSVAAPTAGLHFTRGLLGRLRAAGVRTAFVTLHVGAGTFQPVKTPRLEDHAMHEEACVVPEATARAVAECAAAGGRVVAVGTTALRTLESCALPGGGFRRGWVRTRLFILPGYRFRRVDALITNFHQPGSTLLPLVAAFWNPRGIRSLYAGCLKLGYRFLSYGDACFFQ